MGGNLFVHGKCWGSNVEKYVFFYMHFIIQTMQLQFLPSLSEHASSIALPLKANYRTEEWIADVFVVNEFAQ